MGVVDTLLRISSGCIRAAKYIIMPTMILLTSAREIMAQSSNTPLVSQIDNIKLILTQLGPALSAMLFVLAGVFYALGQMLPPEKKANFHTAAINIIIGAIVVGALSFASASLAVASTQLLNTSNSIK